VYLQVNSVPLGIFLMVLSTLVAMKFDPVKLSVIKQFGSSL